MTPTDLKAWRDHWLYSQSQLARDLDVHITTPQRWERGSTDIPGWVPLALETLERRRAAEWRARARGATANAVRGN